ncbi:MAG: universal stress protein [Haloferacaceae archaeon]
MSNGGESGGDESGYRLLVAVGNPDHVEQLMRTARDVAGDRDGEILVCSVVRQPRVSPVSLYKDEVIKRDYGENEREIVDRAVEMTRGTGVPVTGEVRVGTDPGKSILRAARDHDVDAVLLGWRDRSRADFRLGDTVDRVVHRATCDVLVEKIGDEANGVESVLVPTTGSTHARYAATVAGAIARANDARVEVVHVVAPDGERAGSEDVLDSTAGDVDGVPVETRVLEHEDVADAIVARSSAHDVTVLGASRESILEQLVFGAVPQAVGRRANSTVIMAKRNLGTSRLAQWLRGFAT